MRFIFNHFFFEPLYNALVLIAGIVPGHNIGLAIIVLTLVVKFILLPLQHRMVRTQRKMRELDGVIKDIKDKHKDQAEQARKIFELYRQHGINPFSGFILLLIQFPILLALFFVFRGSFSFDSELIYGFISASEYITTVFLGLDMGVRSVVLAVLVGLSQYTQISLATPPIPPKKLGATPSLKDDLARSMQLQMRYVLPVLIIFVSLGLPAAVPLYWFTGNIFSIVHELIVRRKAKKLVSSPEPTK